MSIYMLNLVFDSTDASETNDARFQEYDATRPILQRSKVWLQATTTPPQPDNPGAWSQLEQDTSLLILDAGDQVMVRICGATTVSGYVGKVTAVVARDAKKASQGPNGKPFQTHGSPFPLSPGSTQSLVIYHTANWQAPSAAGSWVQSLGTVSITTPPPNNPPPGFHDSYSVIVAISAGPGNPGTGPTEFFTYSHDPDMDVNC